MDGDREYNATEYDEEAYMTCTVHPRGECKIHGPALSYMAMGPRPPNDRVVSIRCLSWPLQATDWPTRHRNYGCPDSATISRVINNGCDLVSVAHRQCRQDKLMWRLSFSRAETALLNSWMSVQQILYHVLRVFVKTERLTDIRDSTGTKILSNYCLLYTSPSPRDS